MSDCEYWLRQNFQQVFDLPAPAVDWLLMLWNAIQVFDDVADGDAVKPADLNAAIWQTLVAMPANPFFMQHSATMLPVLAAAILKWHGANEAERAQDHDAKSFVWRAGYYDVVLMVVQCCKGNEFATENAARVMRLYGEDFDQYMKEFQNA